MSSIVLVVSNLGSKKAKSLALLKSAFGLSVAAIRDSVSHGTPVATKRIFERSDPMFPYRLVELLEALTELGCEWAAFEVIDGQVLDKQGRHYEITAARLRKMLAAREGSIEHQRQIGEMEADEE
jgi:hypothetical protein